MSIYTGDKKATLYKGDYRPAELYRGDKKIAGYTLKTFSGQSLTINGTYNDQIEKIRVNGGFVPSRNLLNPIFENGLIVELGERVITSGSSNPYKVVEAKPLTTYTISGATTGMNSNAMRIVFTKDYPKAGGTIVGDRLVFNGSRYEAFTFTTPADCNYILLMSGWIAEFKSDFTDNRLQLEEGNLATDYTPYKEPAFPVLSWGGEEYTIPYVLCNTDIGRDYIEASAPYGTVLFKNSDGEAYSEDISETETGSIFPYFKTTPAPITACISDGTLDITVKISD